MTENLSEIVPVEVGTLWVYSIKRTGAVFSLTRTTMSSRSLHLLLICICITLGSLLAALSPQIFKVRQENIIKLATLGAGLLVGSALGIVIPEWVASEI